jgi:hypothetical protein
MAPETDPLTAELGAIRERVTAATEGPWWSDEDDLMYRLHGVHARTPPYRFPGTDEVMIPEQVLNHQILKAPKTGTPYAEYWPNAADDAFITNARSDVPRLLAAVEAAMSFHAPQEGADGSRFCALCSCAAGEAVRSPCPEVQAMTRELTDKEEDRG